MSEKLRSVNTRFWDDAYVQELSPTEKLLFLYLLTNTLTNLIGIYEITQKRMEFDTGITSQTIQKALERFSKDKKVFYHDGFIILPNFLKHQNLNTNMQIGAIKLFASLPKTIKNSILANGSEALPNDYQTIRNAMLNMNRIGMEVEGEYEGENESEGEYDFVNFSKLSKQQKIEKTIDHYRELWKQARDEKDAAAMDAITKISTMLKEEKLDKVAAMGDQPTLADIKAWTALLTTADICDVYRNLENYTAKKYKSARLTLNNWVKKEYKTR